MLSICHFGNVREREREKGESVLQQRKAIICDSDSGCD